MPGAERSTRLYSPAAATTLTIPLHAGALGVRWIGALPPPEQAGPAPR